MLDFFWGVITSSTVWWFFYMGLRDDLSTAQSVSDAWMLADRDAGRLAEDQSKVINKLRADLARCRARLDKVVAAMRDRE